MPLLLIAGKIERNIIQLERFHFLPSASCHLLAKVIEGKISASKGDHDYFVVVFTLTALPQIFFPIFDIA